MQWFGSFINTIKDGVNKLLSPITQILTSDTTAYASGQFLEGFKAIITFPITMLKMPFNKDSRKLAVDTLKYNFLYYMFPIVAYYGYARAPIQSALEATVGDYIYVADVAMSVALFRSATNAYFYNVFTNINASMIEINPNTNAPDTECTDLQCEGSKHIRGSLMSPFYYIGKTLSSTVLSRVPVVGWFFTLWMKPLALGEGLVEYKITDKCNDHRQLYFAQNNMSSFGMGIAALVSIQGVVLLTTYYTGVSGLWLEDAVFNLMFPFMIFHLHNQPMPHQIKPGMHIDFFYPVRASINKSFEYAGNQIIPRIMNAEQDGNVLEYLNKVWSSLPFKFTRNVILYPSVNNGLNSMVESGPINHLLLMKKKDLREYVSYVKFAVDNSTAINIFLNACKWVPYVAPKDHIAFIMKVLTSDKQQTRNLLSGLSRLIDHAENPQTVITKIHGKPLKVQQLDQSYWGPEGKKNAILTNFEMINDAKLEDDWHEVLTSPPPIPKFLALESKLKEDIRKQKALNDSMAPRVVDVTDEVDAKPKPLFTIIDDYDPSRNKGYLKLKKL